MGTPKAALAWQESTLLHRTASVLAEAAGGPVVVVRAAGQPLPRLPDAVLVTDDPREGLGPLQGIAAGLAALAALGDPPQAAFVAATDLPFLHRVFIRRVLAVLAEDRADVALPVARGHVQPLAAAYRVALAPAADALLAAGRRRPADLFAVCTVSRADEARLLADPALAAADPGLDSLVNVNHPEEYAAAVTRAAGRLVDHVADGGGSVVAAADGDYAGLGGIGEGQDAEPVIVADDHVRVDMPGRIEDRHPQPGHRLVLRGVVRGERDVVGRPRGHGNDGEHPVTVIELA
jgi:molybdenum cofactor guanylyltransferase